MTEIEKMSAKGYSLWLMPTGITHERFSNLIKRLASENTAPIFEPHVTLLGEIIQPEEDVLENTHELASHQKPFQLNLESVDYQDFHFRTLFIRAKKTPELQELFDRARKLFDFQNTEEYMPHMSLLYGTFPQAEKERIIEDIGRDQPAQFTVDRIHVYKTDGEVSSWHKIKEIPFGSI